MSSPSQDRLRALTRRADSISTPLAQLLTRLVFGQAFFLTGLGKLGRLPEITSYFESLGIPLASVQAPMVAVIECAGGILLLAGLGTRVAALLLGCTMVVALVTADTGQFVDGLVFGTSFAEVAPLPFLVGVVWLLAKGPGKVSLDHVIARRGAHE